MRFGFILIIYCLLLPTALWAAPVVRLSFLDVGEGDAVLIQAPDGQAALVDTGNPSAGVRIWETLKRGGVNKLNALILTHPHPDHMGGLFALAQLVSVDGFFDNGEVLPGGEDFQRWYGELIRTGSRYKRLSRGDRVSLGQVELQVLWPPKPLPSKDWNTDSLVLRLKFGRLSCLLMGDANQEAERAMLSDPLIVNVQILKAAHHGAADTAGTEFLSKVSPKLVVISVNKNNLRGYPAGETLARFKAAKAEVERTDRDGTVIVEGEPDGSFILSHHQPGKTPLGDAGNSDY
jgi:competence protein ComEC